MGLTDLLHDEIDYAERQQNRAADLVRTLWAKDLKAILKLADKITDDQAEPWAPLLKALELFAAHVAVKMDKLTTEAARQGVRFGRARRSAR